MRKGWEIKKLGEICDVSAGGDVPKDAFSERMTDVFSVPIYANGEKDNGLLGYTKLPKITRPSVTVSARGTIGYAVKRLDGFYPVVRLIVVTPRENYKLDLSFLYYGLARIDFKHTGTSIPQLTVPMVKLYDIPVPPLSEQQRIVTILDEAFEAIDQAKANTERNRQNARELFQSELNRIFTNKGEGWVEKTLGDLAVFRNGMNFTKQSTGESIKLVGVKDFQSRFWIDLQGLDSVTIDGSLNETDFLKENDILAVRSNGNPELIGRCMLAGPVTEKTSHSGFTIRIRLNSDIIYPPYLCHYLKSTKAKAELIESGTGISIRSLNQGALAALEIPFPNLSEQVNIVSLFDVLSAETKQLEANYQKKLESLEELKKSILQKAFSGELTSETTEIQMEQLDMVAEEQAKYQPNL